MDSENVNALESRPPHLQDLINLCRHLNDAGARYIVVGGMAVIHHGFVRATEDIDLLIDTSPENEQKVFLGLRCLPDQAVRELNVGDVSQYTVVRVADEIVVDLMKSACGIDYHTAAHSVVWVELEGVRIPFANLELLWKLKQTLRDKDKLDRLFIQEKLKNKS